MQLKIDISEDTYNMILENPRIFSGAVFDAIRNGEKASTYFVYNPSEKDRKWIGKWVDKEVRGEIRPYCSVCGDGLDVMYHYNYCPNCGAKMEE